MNVGMTMKETTISVMQRKLIIGYLLVIFQTFQIQKEKKMNKEWVSGGLTILAAGIFSHMIGLSNESVLAGMAIGVVVTILLKTNTKKEV